MGGGTDIRIGGRRPVKVWNSGRTIRKALVVSTYEEFQRKGREKLGLSSEEPISIVLEGDGTQVRSKIDFQFLTQIKFTVLLFDISGGASSEKVVRLRGYILWG